MKLAGNLVANTVMNPPEYSQFGQHYVNMRTPFPNNNLDKEPDE